MRLLEIKFADLYLGKEAAWMTAVPDKPDPWPVPEELRSEADSLRRSCEVEVRSANADSISGHTEADFRLRLEKSILRGSVIRSLTDTVYVLRRFSQEVTPFESINIMKPVKEALMAKNLTGLVVIGGTYGQGKTTTASGLTISRTSHHGGIAITIENPPELPMEGQHGSGVCYQTVAVKGSFAESCRNAMRWAPSIILLGEIRDGETAVEALRASMNGRLVICTAHGEDVISTIRRLHSLATTVTSAQDAHELIAQGLSYVLHQRLVGEATKRTLKVEALNCRVDGTSVRSYLKEGKFDQLGSTIELQRNEMFNPGTKVGT